MNDTVLTETPQKLSRVGFFSKWQVSELPKLLLPGEEILGIISGFYTAGNALLCVTSKRLLLVDKKWMRLSFEDIRFASIKEVNFSQQGMMASVKFYFAGRELQFRSWYRVELRMMAHLVQHKMFEATEKTHYSKISLADQDQMPDSQEYEQIQPMESEPVQPEMQTYYNNAAMEQYLSERIARWRRASRFVDSLPGPRL